MVTYQNIVLLFRYHIYNYTNLENALAMMNMTGKLCLIFEPTFYNKFITKKLWLTAKTEGDVLFLHQLMIKIQLPLSQNTNHTAKNSRRQKKAKNLN